MSNVGRTGRIVHEGEILNESDGHFNVSGIGWIPNRFVEVKYPPVTGQVRKSPFNKLYIRTENGDWTPIDGISLRKIDDEVKDWPVVDQLSVFKKFPKNI